MSRKPINKTIKKNKKKFTRRKRNMKHVNKMQSRKRRGGNNRTKRGGKIPPKAGPSKEEKRRKLEEQMREMDGSVVSTSRPGTPAETSEEDQKGFREPENDYDKLVPTPPDTDQDKEQMEIEYLERLEKNYNLQNRILAYKQNSLERQYKNHNKNKKSRLKDYVEISNGDSATLKELKDKFNKQIIDFKQEIKKYDVNVMDEKNKLEKQNKEYKFYEDIDFDSDKWKRFYEGNKEKTVEQLGKQLTTGHPNQNEKTALNATIKRLRAKMNDYKELQEKQQAEKKAQDAKRKAKEEEDAKKAQEAERKRQEDAKKAKEAERKRQEEDAKKAQNRNIPPPPSLNNSLVVIPPSAVNETETETKTKKYNKVSNNTERKSSDVPNSNLLNTVFSKTEKTAETANCPAKEWDQKDIHKILGKNCTDTDFKEKYRKAAIALHPDKNINCNNTDKNNATEWMKQLNNKNDKCKNETRTSSTSQSSQSSQSSNYNYTQPVRKDAVVPRTKRFLPLLQEAQKEIENTPVPQIKSSYNKKSSQAVIPYNDERQVTTKTPQSPRLAIEDKKRTYTLTPTPDAQKFVDRLNKPILSTNIKTPRTDESQALVLYNDKSSSETDKSQDIFPYNDERQLVSINPPEIPEIDPKCKSRNVNNPNFDDKNICQHSNYIKVARNFHPDKNIKCDDKEKQRAKDIWNELQNTCKDSSPEADPIKASDPFHTFDAMNQELKHIIQNNIHSNPVDFKKILKEFTIQLSVMKNDGKYADYVLDDVSRQLEAFADSIKDYDKEQIKEILKFLNENETTYIVDEDKKLVEAKNRKLKISDGKYVSLPLYNGEPLFRFDKPIKSKVYPKYQLILPYDKLIYKAGIKTQVPDNTDEEFLFARYNNKGFVDKKNIYDYQNTDFLNKLENTRAILNKDIGEDLINKTLDPSNNNTLTMEEQIKLNEATATKKPLRDLNNTIKTKLDDYETILTGLTDTDKLHSYLEYIQENQDKESGIGFFNSIPKFGIYGPIMSIDDKVPLFRIGSPNPIHKLQFQIPEEVFNAIKNKHYSKTNKLVERLINAPILVSEEELKEVHENDIRESIEAVYQVHHTKDEGDKTDGIKIYHYISAIRALRNADNNPKYKNTQLRKSLEKLREQMGGELQALDEKSTDLPYVRPDGNEFDKEEKELISIYAPRTSENINEYDKSGFLGFLKREPIGQEAVEEKGDDELKEVVDPNTEEPSMDVKEIYQDKCRKNISKEKRILGVFDENCIFSEQRPRLYQKAPIIILKRKLRKALSKINEKQLEDIKNEIFPKGTFSLGDNIKEQPQNEFSEKLKVNKFFKQKTSATEKILLTQELTTANKDGKSVVTLKSYDEFIADLLNNKITIGGAKKNYIANKIKDVEYNLNNGFNDKLNNKLTAYMRNVANLSYDVNEKSKHIQKCFVDIDNPDAYNILGIVGDINGLICLLQNKESFEFIKRPVVTITKEDDESDLAKIGL